MSEEQEQGRSEAQRLLRQLRGEGRVIDTARGPIEPMAEVVLHGDESMETIEALRDVALTAGRLVGQEAGAVAVMTGRPVDEADQLRGALALIALTTYDRHLVEALKGADQLIIDTVGRIRETALASLRA